MSGSNEGHGGDASPDPGEDAPQATGDAGTKASAESAQDAVDPARRREAARAQRRERRAAGPERGGTIQGVGPSAVAQAVEKAIRVTEELSSAAAAERDKPAAPATPAAPVAAAPAKGPALAGNDAAHQPLQPRKAGGRARVATRVGVGPGALEPAPDRTKPAVSMPRSTGLVGDAAPPSSSRLGPGQPPPSTRTPKPATVAGKKPAALPSTAARPSPPKVASRGDNMAMAPKAAAEVSEGHAQRKAIAVGGDAPGRDEEIDVDDEAAADRSDPAAAGPAAAAAPVVPSTDDAPDSEGSASSPSPPAVADGARAESDASVEQATGETDAEQTPEDAEPSKGRMVLLLGAVVALSALGALAIAWAVGLLEGPADLTEDATAPGASASIDGADASASERAADASTDADIDGSAAAVADAGDGGEPDAAATDAGSLEDAGGADAEATEPAPKAQPRPTRTTAPRPRRPPPKPKKPPQRYEPNDI